MHHTSSIYQEFAYQVAPLLAQADQLGYRVPEDVQASMEQSADACHVMHTYVAFDLHLALSKKAQQLNDEIVRNGMDPDALMPSYLRQYEILELLVRIQEYAYRVEAAKQLRATT